MNKFLVLVLIFGFISQSYQNIPAVSCSSVESLDIQGYGYEPGPLEPCHNKIVCKMSCSHLNYNKFKNSNYNRTFDLTSYYNADNIGRRTYDLACLTRIFYTGIDDWTDKASIIFREFVTNTIHSPSDLSYLNTTCPEIVKLEPNITKLRQTHPETYLDKGFTYNQIISCFGDFDSKYFNWSSNYNGLNFTKESNFTEWNSLKALLFYKDTMPGFQETCGKLYGDGSGLTPIGRYGLLDTALSDFETYQKNDADFQNEEEKKFNYIYQYYKLRDEIFYGNGDLTFIDNKYQVLKDYFINNAFEVDRRYCRCENIKLLSDVFKSDMNKTGNGTYPSISTLRNMKNVTAFGDLMIELCMNNTPSNTPQTSPNPSYSPKISIQMSPHSSPQNSPFTPEVSPIPTISNSPTTSPSPSPAVSRLPKISPIVSSNFPLASPIASNSPVASPSTSNQPNPKDSPITSISPNNSPKISQMKPIASSFPTSSKSPKLSPINSPKVSSQMNPSASNHPNSSPKISPKNSISASDSISPSRSNFSPKSPINSQLTSKASTLSFFEIHILLLICSVFVILIN
eukprot:gene6612-10775_t